MDNNNIEIWKDVADYEGSYQVSNLGRVKSLSRDMWNGRTWWKSKEKILKERWSKNKLGYPSVNLVKERKAKSVRIHNLVADAFVPKIKGKRYVNHIDEDKSNNHADNLEWVTPKENLNYRGNQKRKGNKKSTPVIGTNIITGDKIILKTAREKREAGFRTDAISHVCRKKAKTHKGYTWDYYTETE